MAATADIVLFVDGSGSLLPGETGVDAYPWFRQTVLDLDVELRSRGIGADDPQNSGDDHRQNRYSVVTFGGGPTNQWTFSGWLSVNAASVAIGPFPPSGGIDHEDGVEALVLASDEDFEGPVNFDFRNDAAVHYIFFTDTGTGDGSTFGPDFDRKSDAPMAYRDATYGQILELLDATNLLDANGEGNNVSNATITFLGGAGFDESQFPTFAPNGPQFGAEILGVDLNVADSWDLHEQMKI